MPAITLGLAEVEERLQALRWRLNSLTAQHGVYIASATAILLSAVLIPVGLRASPATFRIVACASAMVLLVVVLACVSYAWWRWSDVQTVAHLVDERAQLTDRLATLVDLRFRPRPSRLAPVLVAQTLALGARWQAQRIVPRRVARSVFLLLAALVALASTTALERQTRQHAVQGAATPAGQPASMDKAAASESVSSGRTSAAPVAGEPAGLQAHGDADRAGTVPGAGSESPRQHGSRATTGGPAAAVQEGPAWLTDRLQQAITDAFRAEKLDTRAQRHARGGRASAPDARPQADDDARRGSDADAGRSSSAHARGTGEGKNRTASPSAQTATQRQGGANAPQNFEGDSPGAGEGSSPQGLMQATAQELNVKESESKPFTLTINSFLRTLEANGAPLQRPANGPGLTSLATARAGNPVALNEHQLSDDALRKAEIPPQYEDLVRGVFSLRAGR
jgi:hypothetical protein